MQGKRVKTNDGMLANFRYRKKWKRATSILSIFVVIGTISSLMLPAITMNQIICGVEEHSHDLNCYFVTAEPVLSCNADSLGLHRHTSPCCDAEGNLICDQVDFVVHAHDSACFNGDGALVCTLREVAEHSHDESCYQAEEIVIDEGHSHSDSCYEMVTSETPTCGVEESSGHQHGEGCYATGTELICTETESSGHAHSPECNGEDSSVACDLEESTGHTHEASCYLEAGSLMCTTPESDGHQHSEGCYGLFRGELVCTEEEREPVIEQGEPKLICEKEEAILHTHKGTCFEYDAQGNVISILCEKREVKEHRHADSCFTEQEVKTLICELPEHTHTDECREEEPTTDPTGETGSEGSSESTVGTDPSEATDPTGETGPDETTEPSDGTSEETQSPLTQEEETQVEDVIVLIEGLPQVEEIEAEFDRLAEDEEGLAAYRAKILSAVQVAFDEYNVLTDAQKAAVTNGEKLESYRYLLDEQKIADITAQIEALPSVEEIEAEFSRLESDPDALEAYREAITSMIRGMYDAYLALTEAQKETVPNADKLAQYDYLLYYKEETLTVSADGCSVTISCPAEARIPADAVVEMAGIPSGSPEHQHYFDLAAETLSGYTIQDARFFDITILSQGRKIQPAADVTLTITFDEPMAAQVKDTCQIVHFGAEGAELLDGYATRDNNTVSGVTFCQGSFSVSGVLLTQPLAVNDADSGPDSMKVDYYIHLNGSWQKVGSTSTGWYNKYNTDKSDSSINGPYTRDYVTEAQVASVFGPYGFRSEGDSARTVAYELMDGSSSNVWSDTHTDTINGVRVIPLSQGKRNYNLYFIPNNTVNGAVAGRDNMFNKFNGEYQFYSIDVFDPQHLAFQTDAECQAQQVIFLSHTDPTITLPEIAGSWQFVHDGDELNNDLKFTSNSDATESCTVHALSQHLRVMPKVSTAYGPDPVNVTYMVYLDGAWQEVGKTEQGWLSNDHSSWASENRDRINMAQIEEVLAPFGFSANNYTQYTLLYQKRTGNLNIYNDTKPFTDASGKVTYYPMSHNTGPDYEYVIYYAPGATAQVKTGDENGVKTSANIPTAGSEFYTITVRDDEGWVYTPEELAEVNCMRARLPGTQEWNHFAVAVKKNQTAKVTVERAGWGWKWRHGTDNTMYQGLFAHTSIEDSNPDDSLISLVIASSQTTEPLILDADGNSWNSSTAGPQSGDLNTVSGQGITFRLFDYRADINELLRQKGLVYTADFNDTAGVAKNYFYFRDVHRYINARPRNATYDHDGFYHYENGGPNHTTVYRNLSGGYPRFDFTHKGNVSAPSVDGTSLNFLFSGNDYVRQYNCVNTPLWFDESDGYYKYGSVTNAADYDTASNTWYIRNRVERGASTAGNYSGYADFLPFNNGDGTAIGTSDKGQDYQYNIDEVDYWFGMMMNVEFFQGKDGMMGHNGDNREMEFYFSGDDDVWLFIDNMLVLDIGGTHGAVDGTVNFHTGLVTAFYNFNGTVGNTEDRRCTSTTLYECYRAAMIEAGVANVEERLNDIFVSTGETVTDKWGRTYPVYRFKNYSSHNMKFFYMERGSDASNCTIEFNLPTLPDETLFVGKELEFDDSTMTPEQIAFARENLAYRFRVVNSEENPIFSNAVVEVFDETLKNQVGTTTLDGDGWFTLKAGQRVKFEHMLKTLQDLNLPKLEYYVQEAIPASLVGQYNGVVYKDGGTSGEVSIEGEDGQEWVVYKTNALSPENTYTVIYTNKVDVEKMSFLQLRKEVQPGSIYSGDETFPVVVTLGGVPVPAGTQFHYPDNGETVAAEEGGIVQLKIGRTLQLTAPILAGTPFTICENATDGWSFVGCTTTHGSVNQNSVSGEIPLDATVVVIITNRTNDFGVSVPISKEFQGGKANVTRTATFHMEQVTDKNGTTAVTSAMIQDVTISCTGGSPGAGEFKLGYEADTPPGAYYYRITETAFTADPSENFIQDKTVYVVEIQIENSAAMVTALYVDGKLQSETIPAFVNRFATVELPDCGGAGTLTMPFAG